MRLARIKRACHVKPAGSGLTMYRDFEMETDEEAESEADYVDLSVLVNRSNAL